MNALRLTYEPDNHSHGQLHAVVNVDGFSGDGSAWFIRADLASFAQKLDAYPLSAATPISLSGGIFANGHLTEVLLRIAVSPHDTSGRLLIEVELATDPIAGEPQQRGAFQFLTEYAALDTFRAAFRRMLVEEGFEAVLQSADGMSR